MKITGKSTDTATMPFFSLSCFSGTMLPLYRQQDRHLGHTIFQDFSQISCNSYLLTIFVKFHSMLPISEKKKKIKITYFYLSRYVREIKVFKNESSVLNGPILQGTPDKPLLLCSRRSTRRQWYKASPIPYVHRTRTDQGY